MASKAKRAATSELNHDNWDDEDENVEEAGHFKEASKDVLQTRVIKKARRRGATASNATSGVFAGFSGLSGASASSTPSTAGFDFLKTAATSNGAE